MSDLKVALGWLREGKKIRRPSWDSSSYLFLMDDINIVNDRLKDVKFNCINSLEAVDWEIYESEDMGQTIRCLQKKLRWYRSNFGKCIYDEILGGCL